MDCFKMGRHITTIIIILSETLLLLSLMLQSVSIVLNLSSSVRRQHRLVAVRARQERGRATCIENSFSRKKQHDDGRTARSRLVAIKQFSKQAPHPPHH